MKIIQYTFSIPKDKQKAFIQYAKSVLAPTWEKYGCRKYELVKVKDQEIINKQIIEQNRFIERLYFNNDFNFNDFYQNVREHDPDIAKSYEEKFNVRNIQLKVLEQLINHFQENC